MEIATIYHYVSSFEISDPDLLSKEHVYKAVQEGIFPHWFNKMWADLLFSDEKDSEVSMMDFVGLFISARLFHSKTDTRLIDFT